jgi:hypothetical protein
MRAQTLEIKARDIELGMRLLLIPEYCPVRVVSRIGDQVSVMLPGRNVFTVPASTLRRIGTWRDAGVDRGIFA